MQNDSAAGRFSQLETGRQTYLDRARDAAKLTIPSLFPPQGTNATSRLPQPHQSIGARGVNNLSAKLLLALLPPNSPFFRLLIDDFMMEKLTQRPGMRGEFDKALNKIERAVQTEIEATALRVGVFEALKQLVVSGNVLLYLAPKGGLRVYRLDRYVVVRSPMGEVLEIITKETVAPAALPKELADLVGKDTKGHPEKTLDLYTCIKRERERFVVYQEIKGIKVPGSWGTYPLDKSPWMALRWTKMDGEDYGRGYVEEYIGDLRSLEGLSKAILEGSAAAARVLFLVKPNGTTRMKDVAEAQNGDVKAGDAEDVSVLQLGKFADFRTAEQQIARLQQNLAFAFLLNTAVQRGGERVTAEEIRYMAGELEDALGGVYSILSQEFQLPLVSSLMHRLERQGRLPPLPKGTVRPAITTGLEALGRGHDLSKLNIYTQQIAALGPNAMARIKEAELISRIGTALGIDQEGLIKSDDEIAMEQQRAQMMALMEKLGPNAMNILRDQLAPNAGQPPQGAPQGVE